MSTDKIRWDSEPGPAEPYIPIYSSVAGGTIHLIALNHSIVGVWTHWVDGHVIPCVGKLHGCICQNGQTASRWKGYLGAWDSKPCRKVLAEITADAWRQFGWDEHASNLSLRGLPFKLFRIGRHKNAPARFQLESLSPVPDELPGPMDVHECLRRIWGIPHP